MNTLIMNAAEGRIQIALAQEETLLCAQEWSAPSKGTELLTPVLADMLGRLGLRPASVDRIACVAGPGSFTGLRLVLTTAAAFRRATGASVAPLNVLQALAASLPFAALFPDRPSLRVRAVTHARRGLVHGQDFLVSPGSLPLPQGEPAMWELTAACGGPRRRRNRQRPCPQSCSFSGYLYFRSAPLPALSDPSDARGASCPDAVPSRRRVGPTRSRSALPAALRRRGQSRLHRRQARPGPGRGAGPA